MKKTIIIDSNAVLHRAFYALPPLKDKQGNPSGAIYGFLLLFFKLLKEFKPDFIIAVFDYPAPTFRHKRYKAYKAQRKKAPQNLYDQISEAKIILKKIGLKVLEKKGYEADDIIASIANICSKKNIESIIVSGDLDVLQLVNKKTKAYLLKIGVKQTILYDEKEVEKKYQGLKPEQLADFRALRGDASDNIPGIPGVGEKTAITLLKKYYSIEKIYKEPLLEEKISKGKELAFLSKELAKIKNNAINKLDLNSCLEKKIKKENIIKMLEKKGFNKLAKNFSITENLKLF